jgi:hypothetical protein
MKPQDVKRNREVEYYLSRMKSKSYDMLFDWCFHRTRRAAKVSQTFKDIVRH